MNAIHNNRSIEQLRESRREMRRLWIDEREPGEDQFPRSKTLRLLMNARTVTLLGIGVGGLLLFRPAWIGRALRLVPVTSVLRMAATRLLNRV
jgi:hypothetical protein